MLMIILLISFIFILFISINIDVVLYDYNIDYRVHKVLEHIIEFSMLIVVLGILITCISSINDDTHKSIKRIPIVTPIVMPIR
nr:MAG TPA: hypothetical protein [Crassvirales sp.]